MVISVTRDVTIVEELQRAPLMGPVWMAADPVISSQNVTQIAPPAVQEVVLTTLENVT